MSFDAEGASLGRPREFSRSCVLDAPSTDEVTPTSPDGGSGDVITTIPGGPDVEVRTLPIDPNAVTTTARADANGQSTTMGG